MEDKIIKIDKAGKTYSIKIVHVDPNEAETILWQDTQRAPFWTSQKRTKEMIKSLQKLFPTLMEEKINEIIVNIASADNYGDISVEDDKTREDEITDKSITDYIAGRHLFYCDKKDPNLTLYIWNDGVWHNGLADGDILHDLTQIFAAEDNRARMVVEKTTNFIKGAAMDTKVEEATPNLVLFKNGLLDLSEMTLNPHSPKIFCVNQIPHEYNQEAKCPKWVKFIGEVIKKEDLAFFQEWVGYNFYLGCPEAAFVIFIGNGQNGKTIIINILTWLLGEENVTNISLVDLTYDGFAPAELFHRLANIADDIGSTVIKRAGKLRECSGSSRIKGERKYGQPFYFKPYAKITYACNEPPEIKDQSDAVKMRLKVVEFPVKFSKNPVNNERLARDRGTIERELKEEASGIINWGIEGLMRLVKNNFKFTVSRSTEDTWTFYKRVSSPVAAFLEECLTMTDDDFDKLTIEGMYKSFCEWKEESKIQQKISRDKMIKQLREEGVETGQKREDNRKRMYYGVTVSRPKYARSGGEKEEKEEEKRREEVGKGRENKERDGVSLDQWDKYHAVNAVIMELDQGDGCDKEELRQKAMSQGITESFIDHFLDEELKKGHLFEPKPRRIKRAV